MPYNSSSFEKQLAKYKQAQVEKSIGDMPRKKYEQYSDPHQTKSKISSERGTIKSYALEPVQIMGEGAQTAPLARERIAPTIVRKKAKKAWYKRTWFILLVLTTLPTFAMPIFYKDQWNEMMGMVASIKSSTGVDALSLSTYTNLMKGKPVTTEGPASSDQMAVEEQPAHVDESELSQPMDMRNAVEAAQDRANAITSKGAGYSMQYIEDETKRLNDAAKQFDQQYKK